MPEQVAMAARKAPLMVLTERFPPDDAVPPGKEASEHRTHLVGPVLRTKKPQAASLRQSADAFTDERLDTGKVLLGRKKISLSSGTVIDPDVVRWINKHGLDKLLIGQPLQDVMAVAVDHLVGRWHFGWQHDVDL